MSCHKETLHIHFVSIAYILIRNNEKFCVLHRIFLTITIFILTTSMQSDLINHWLNGKLDPGLKVIKLFS